MSIGNYNRLSKHAKRLGEAARESYIKAIQGADKDIATIFSTVSHKDDGAVGLVRAIYLDGDFQICYDVQIGEHILEATPARNWKVLDRTEGDG